MGRTPLPAERAVFDMTDPRSATLSHGVFVKAPIRRPRSSAFFAILHTFGANARRGSDSGGPTPEGKASLLVQCREECSSSVGPAPDLLRQPTPCRSPRGQRPD